jgi:hypothetical protein
MSYVKIRIIKSPVGVSVVAVLVIWPHLDFKILNIKQKRMEKPWNPEQLSFGHYIIENVQ